MSLEDYNSTESPEGGSQGAEVSKKYREAAKKAEAGIKRTQKDEKKAKKYDFLLAKFLVEMILKKKYDNLLDELFICLDSGYGTNFLLGVLSLIYLPISHEIRRFSEKPEILFQYEISGTSQDFDDKEIAEPIRLRVNAWIEDMESISQMEVSSIITKRTLGLILYDEKIRSFTSAVFKSFFLELNIHMDESKSKSYSDFILGQLEKTLANNMPELTKKWTQEGLEI